MNLPADLKYTKEHEWIKIDGDMATIGITDFAQGELGDIVYVDINTLNESLKKDEVFGTVEAVKTVSDLFMPVDGTIVEINPKLTDAPDSVNKDPYGDGWMVKVKISDASQLNALLTADGYAASEKTEATLYWINANLETANINLAKTRGIVASAHDGIVSISGLDNGEVVKFYAADGKLLGSSSAVGGVASCAVSEKMVIAKIGMDSIKVLIK